MGFEPLRTDEELPPGHKQGSVDFESAMLGGCSSFTASSIIGYFLGLWPFLVFQTIDQVKTFELCAAAGMLPAILFGILAARKAGLAGACGFVAGQCAFAVFLNLRMRQAFLAAYARQAKPPQYPEFFQWLVPVVWVLGCLAIALFLYKATRTELLLSNEQP